MRFDWHIHSVNVFCKGPFFALCAHQNQTQTASVFPHTSLLYFDFCPHRIFYQSPSNLVIWHHSVLFPPNPSPSTSLSSSCSSSPFDYWVQSFSSQIAPLLRSLSWSKFLIMKSPDRTSSRCLWLWDWYGLAGPPIWRCSLKCYHINMGQNRFRLLCFTFTYWCTLPIYLSLVLSISEVYGNYPFSFSILYNTKLTMCSLWYTLSSQ